MGLFYGRIIRGGTTESHNLSSSELTSFFSFWISKIFITCSQFSNQGLRVVLCIIGSLFQCFIWKWRKWTLTFFDHRVWFHRFCHTIGTEVQGRNSPSTPPSIRRCVVLLLNIFWEKFPTGKMGPRFLKNNHEIKWILFVGIFQDSTGSVSSIHLAAVYDCTTSLKVLFVIQGLAT